MTPEKILRNLDHGYFMTHEEQAEAAAYIRQLQQSNEVLREGLLKSAEEVVRLRQQFNLWNKGETCAVLCDEAKAARLAEQIRARSEPNPAFKNYMDDNWAGIV